MNEIGKQIILLGLIVTGIGFIIAFREHLPFLRKIGHLPGDIVIKKENFSFYFPLVTSLIASLILSLLFYLFKK